MTTPTDERERFEEFYVRKWDGVPTLWGERYPSHQRVYARAVYGRRNDAIAEKVRGRTGRFLDVGCGVGDLMVHLATGDRIMTGVDPSSTNVAFSRQNLERFGGGGTATLAEAESLPFADATFECVLFADVIEHVLDVGAALREARRVLRPGGLLVCVTPIRRTLAFWRAVDSGITRVMSGRRPEPALQVRERFLSEQELGCAIRSAGFRVRSRDRICFYPAPERAGAVGALLYRASTSLGPSTFATLAGSVERVFATIDALGVFGQKQMWTAER